MPVYRGNGGGGKQEWRIPSTTGLRGPGKLVTCARSGALVNADQCIRQNGRLVWIKYADQPSGSEEDDR